MPTRALWVWFALRRVDAFVLRVAGRAASRAATPVPEVDGLVDDWIGDYLVKAHEERLEAAARARLEVEAAYAPRIAELEARIAVVRAGEATAGPPAEVPNEVTSPAQELTCLEYEVIPMNVVSKAAPLESSVLSVKRVIGAEAPGEICHVVLETRGQLPYVEGQSVGVLPPGTDGKTGRAYQQRLYSIASTRYGDDCAGTSVSLCVRRAVYVDPATGLEDGSKKGVCSNFLCDGRAGDVVSLTGPTGKGMLLPEDDDADIIMVATGTGIAPFRAFALRLFVERNPRASAFRGRAWLFLGVPTTSSLLYEGLWDGIRRSNPDAFQTTYAISREESNADGSRVYVQDRISEHATELFDRLDAGAHIYFCGLKGMMPGIEAALSAAAAARNRDWKTELKRLKKAKQWHVEVY